MNVFGFQIFFSVFVFVISLTFGDTVETDVVYNLSRVENLTFVSSVISGEMEENGPCCTPKVLL